MPDDERGRAMNDKPRRSDQTDAGRRAGKEPQPQPQRTPRPKGKPAAAADKRKPGGKRARPLRQTAKKTLAREESRSRNADYYDTAPVGYFAISHTGRITAANLRGAALLGVPQQTLIRHDFGRFVVPEEIDRWDRHRLDALQQEGAVYCELTLQRADGSTFHARLDSIRTATSAGAFALRTTVADISDQKKVEETLRESEERYRALFDRSLDCVYIHDFEGRFLDANDATLNLLGYTREEIADLNFTSMLSEDQLPLASKTLQEIRETGFQKDLTEYRLRLRNGNEVYLEIKGSAILSKGTYTAIQAVARNITERKKAEANLVKSKALLSETEKIGKIGGWVFDAETLTQTWTEETFCILEIDSTQGEPKVPEGLDFVAPAFRPMAEQAVQRAIEFGEPYDQEWEIITAKGNTRWVRAVARTHQEQGITKRISGSFQDITDRKQAEETLRESESSLQAILRSTADGLLAISREGKVLFANERFGQMWRIPQELIAGKDDAALIQYVLDQLTDPQGFLQKVQQLYASDEDSFDTLYFKDGRVFDRLSRPLLRGSELRGRLWSFRDITERKRVEEALRESEHRLADIIDFLPDATFAINLKGEVVAWNRALEELTGAAKEELIGKGELAYAVLFYGKTAPMLIDMVFQDWKEIEKNYDYLIKREDQLVAEAFVPALRGGKGAYLWGIASPLYDSNGSIVGAIESLRDITERKELEREAILRSRLLEAASDAVLVHDLEGHFLYVNEAACRMHGYARAELLTIPLARLVTPEGVTQVEERIQKIAQQGELTFEVEHLTKFGARIPIEVHASFQQLDGRKYILSVMRDIRERKQLEAEVKKAQTDFLFAVSHELKTPLLIMAATGEMVELLPVEQQVERFREYTDIWKRNLIRLRTIIDNLVDSQRSPRTGIKLSAQLTDLGALVEHVLEELAPLAEKKGLRFQRELDPVRPLSLDPEASARILTNLLINAIKFSPTAGALRIKLAEEADHAVLQIVDQGPGIPADEIPNLFQPFRRGSVSVKVVVPGTGLGLYVCRILTEAQGGTISLESTVGRGTMVTVRFPLTDRS